MFDLLSPIHLVILLVIVLLVFGPRRLPEIGSGLGKGIREFKRAMDSITSPTPDKAASLPPKTDDTGEQ
jgi:sec-independent protein translocase protein TatA